MADLLGDLAARRPDLAACLPDLEGAFDALSATFAAGGKLLVCGNGGSAADAGHIVGELMKGFALPRRVPERDRQRLLEADEDEGAYLAETLQGALPAIALTSHAALLTAIANDVAFDMVFAQQVYGYGEPGDALLGISTSGDALDVVRAMQVARAVGLRTVALTGPAGGRLAALADVVVRAPGGSVSEVQEGHLALYHCLCALLEQEFFGAG